MIQVTLVDGRKFWLDKAEVTLKWGADKATLAEVATLTVIDPRLRVADGALRGMPIRGLLMEDSSDLVVELPMPLADARELGEKLMTGTKIELLDSLVVRPR